MLQMTKPLLAILLLLPLSVWSEEYVCNVENVSNEQLKYVVTITRTPKGFAMESSNKWLGFPYYEKHEIKEDDNIIVITQIAGYFAEVIVITKGVPDGEPLIGRQHRMPTFTLGTVGMATNATLMTEESLVRGFCMVRE